MTLCRDSDFLSDDALCKDETLLPTGDGERGRDEDEDGGFRAGTTGRLLKVVGIALGLGGVLGGAVGTFLIAAIRGVVIVAVPTGDVSSTEVERSKRRCFWISGPMWEMWLKLVGAEINLERRSEPLKKYYKNFSFCLIFDENFTTYDLKVLLISRNENLLFGFTRPSLSKLLVFSNSPKITKFNLMVIQMTINFNLLVCILAK